MKIIETGWENDDAGRCDKALKLELSWRLPTNAAQPGSCCEDVRVERKDCAMMTGCPNGKMNEGWGQTAK